VNTVVSNAIKTIVTMFGSAVGYVVIVNAMSNVINNAPLNADSKFAFFIIGLVYGVYVSHKQEWIG
jgi:hypothetical protein